MSMPVKRKSRPWLGFFVGLILGIALAIIFQQAGWWPLDQLLLFGMMGVFGLVGILVGGAGRASVRFIVVLIPLLLAIAGIAYGAVGIPDATGNGELKGGCKVTSTTPLDSTIVTDTSASEPFDVAPDGPLSWTADSPVVFMDHLWNIYVEVGGFKVRIAGNDVPEPNEDGETHNEGSVASVSGYVQDVTYRTGDELRGVFVVSGDITGGATCSGFGFVRLVDDPFASLLAKIALGLAILMIIILIIIFIRRSYMAEVAVDTAVVVAAADGSSLDGVEGVDQAVDEDVDDAIEGYEPGSEDLPGPDDLV